MKPLKVFIGWDSREKTAYEVLKHSIEKHTTAKVDIIPLYHKELRKQGYFKRPWQIKADGNYEDQLDNKPFSTEFSHTRFLVPEIMNFDGWALFMDCDMIFRDDVRKVFEHADDKYAVMCVKHNQNVDTSIKMDGSPQEKYYRKNWSSFMLWNCGHPKNKVLDRYRVNWETGTWLHQFSWLDDKDIGELPKDYNWIEGTSPSNLNPKVIHYTLGGPWFDSYQDVLFNDEWWKYYRSMHHDLPDPAVTLSTVNYRNV